MKFLRSVDATQSLGWPHMCATTDPHRPHRSCDLSSLLHFVFWSPRSPNISSTSPSYRERWTWAFCLSCAHSRTCFSIVLPLLSQSCGESDSHALGASRSISAWQLWLANGKFMACLWCYASVYLKEFMNESNNHIPWTHWTKNLFVQVAHLPMLAMLLEISPL